MTTLSASTSIARPPDEVFAYLDDIARRPEWQLDLQETKVLTEGPTRVGTEVEEVRQMGRKSMQIRWRVTEHEPPRRSAFETYEAKVIKPSGVITVEPSGDGSVVRFEMEPNPSGLAKLMMPMIGRQIRKNIEADLAKLKQNLEA